MGQDVNEMKSMRFVESSECGPACATCEWRYCPQHCAEVCVSHGHEAEDEMWYCDWSASARAWDEFMADETGEVECPDRPDCGGCEQHYAFCSNSTRQVHVLPDTFDDEVEVEMGDSYHNSSEQYVAEAMEQAQIAAAESGAAYEPGTDLEAWEWDWAYRNYPLLDIALTHHEREMDVVASHLDSPYDMGWMDPDALDTSISENLAYYRNVHGCTLHFEAVGLDPVRSWVRSEHGVLVEHWSKCNHCLDGQNVPCVHTAYCG